MLASFGEAMKTVYYDFRFLLEGATLLPVEKEVFEAVLSGKAPRNDLQYSLKNLTVYLERYYGKQVLVLIDEYDAPIQYLVKFDRDVESGIKLVNEADKFPNTVQLLLYCSYVDPCSDSLKPCYVLIESFMADPSMTISLDRETQEMDFNGQLQMSYCGTQKTLYTIFFPDEEIVSQGVSA